MRDDTDRSRDGKDPSARHLRLIHPAPPKPAPLRRGQRPPLFTADEEARILAAFRNAQALFGGWACLADAMYVRRRALVPALYDKHTSIPADLVIRLAQALGKPVESLYAAPTRVDRCPHCGATRRP